MKDKKNVKNIETPTNESTLDALKRLSAHSSVKEYCSEPYIRLKPVIAEEQFLDLEQQQGFSYPTSLRNFSLQLANGFEFMIYPLYIEFEFFGLGLHSYYKVGNIGILEFLRCTWYDNHSEDHDEIRNWYIERGYDTEEWLTAIDYVNDNYKVFGRFNVDNENQYLFVYGRNGKMGIVKFAQDWWEELNELMRSDRIGDVLVYDSFDYLISRLVSVMNAELTRCDEDDDYCDEYDYLWKQWQTID